MTPEACRNQLGELLRTQIACIGDANDYLLAIRDAIASNRLEPLQQSLHEPRDTLERIESLEQQRQQLLTSCGFDAGDDAFGQCLRWCDDENGRLDTLYRQLIQDLTQLQRSIQLNCLLVSKGQDRVRRSIGILTGLGSSQGAKIYGKSGKTQNPGGRRNIAIA